MHPGIPVTWILKDQAPGMNMSGEPRHEEKRCRGRRRPSVSGGIPGLSPEYWTCRLPSANLRFPWYTPYSTIRRLSRLSIPKNVPGIALTPYSTIPVNYPDPVIERYRRAHLL